MTSGASHTGLPPLPSVSGSVHTGYSDAMPDEDIPDEVPVADAFEQQLPAVDPALDDDDELKADEAGPPLEASPPDWQEQHEEVPELDEFDRG
jgi:hypothetical protein